MFFRAISHGHPYIDIKITDKFTLALRLQYLKGTVWGVLKVLKLLTRQW